MAKITGGCDPGTKRVPIAMWLTSFIWLLSLTLVAASDASLEAGMTFALIDVNNDDALSHDELQRAVSLISVNISALVNESDSISILNSFLNEFVSA